MPTSPAAPDNALLYGEEFAIVATTERGDRRRVSAREVASPGPAPPTSRYAVFDTRSSESVWRVLDRDGRASEDGLTPGPVKYGDVVTLGVVAWVGNDAQTIYLSARDDNKNGERRRVGVAYDPGPWEAWTIVDPLAPESTAIVTRGSAFVLKSSFGDYLSQTTDGDKRVVQTAPSSGPGESWMLGRPVLSDPKPLKHQNWISVVRTDPGERKYSHMSAGPGAPTLTAPAWDASAKIVFDRSGLSELSRWMVERVDGQQRGISFGDVVYLGIRTHRDPANPKPLYLQYLAQQRGGVKVAVAPASGGRDWERWKIVDPALPASTAQVRYGDRFALQGLSGAGEYLSSPRGGASVGTAATHGADQTFTIADAATEVSQETSAPATPGWHDSAAILEVGRNWTKFAVTKAAAMIPYGGGIASGVIDALWTDAGPNIWDLIKEQVKALVRSMIDQNNIDQLDAQVKQLAAAGRKFKNQDSSATKVQALGELLGYLNGVKAEASRLLRDNPQQALPYYAAIGTVHIAALQEEFINLKTFYPGATARDVTGHRQALKDTIAEYSGNIKAAREAALKWRRGLIKNRVLGWTDEYLESDALIFFGRNGGDATPYAKEVVEIFGTQLDAAMLPSLLWRYLDPDVDEAPALSRATLVTGPYGKFGNNEGGRTRHFGGSFFWNLPGAPIATIRTHAGDAVYALSLVDSNRKETKVLKAEGADNELALRPDERFVSAYGNHGWACHSLNLKTNQGREMKAGRQYDLAWSATLPEDSHPYLTGISCTTGDPGLCQVYLHWSYERWE